MQINLKQLEIEAALKMFIAQQGINLTGKTVEIAFTSGRKDNGLSAEITIEDATQAVRLSSLVPGIDRTFEAKPAVSLTTTEVPEPALPEEVTATKPISLFTK